MFMAAMVLSDAEPGNCPIGHKCLVSGGEIRDGHIVNVQPSQDPPTGGRP
jgi:hypothetical protein